MLDEHIICERLDRVAGKLDKLNERWNNRLTLDNLALAKRYIKGELRVVVDFHAGGCCLKEYCAVFQRKLPISRSEEDGGKLHVLAEQFRHFGTHVDANAPMRRPDRDDHPVFVQNVELVDQPQCLIVPSVVWLEPLDCVDSVLGRSLYVTRNFGFKFLGCREDGKLRLSYVTGAQGNDLAREKIKCGAKVVDGVADGAAQADGDILLDPYAEKAISSLRIVVSDDFVGVSGEECTDVSPQISDVAFGPFDL